MSAKDFMSKYKLGILFGLVMIVYILTAVGAFYYGADLTCHNGGGLVVKNLGTGKIACVIPPSDSVQLDITDMGKGVVLRD